jgi:intracellular septation protein A
MDSAREPDVPPLDAREEDRLRRGYLRPDFRVWIGALPALVFLVLNWQTTTEIAIAASFAASVLVFVRNPGSGVIRALSALSFSIVAASAAAGLILDSGKAFVAQNLIGDFVIAAVFLVSVLVRRPMIGAIAREMVPAMKPVLAVGHPVFVKLTLISVALNVVSGVVRLFLLDALSENQYVIVSRALGFPPNVLFFLYAYRQVTRVAIRIWPADAPPPPEWRPASR